MAWNPEVYNKFKKERYAPFYDLLSLCSKRPGMKVVDLGCGTGELTRILSDYLPDADVLGIDSSQEMLNNSIPFSNDRTHFLHRSIDEQISTRIKWDLIFSNAALQWIDNHESLFTKLIALLNKGGELAIQIPSNNDHFTHRSLMNLASVSPYQEALGGWKRNLTALPMEDYANIFFRSAGTDIIIYQKLYPHLLADADDLFDWVSGTAIIPYIERLPDTLKEAFKNDYRQRLHSQFRESPVLYTFKRTIMKARF